MNISRHIPNLVSVARIIATPILVYLAFAGSENPFKCLLPWTSDVRGLYWVLEKQRLGTA